MHIDIIETLPSLARLEDNWNAVYDADPEAQIFLSWKWLHGWLPHIKGPWFILAAKASNSAGAPYVAFLPLRLDTTIENSSDVLNHVRMAGNFAADYTGIVCAPDTESKAIPAFARYIKQMNWARFNFENVRMSERRFRLLLAYFPKGSFKVTEVNRVGKVDGIDNSLCPYAELPKDWSSYLQSLSANTRQKIRRLLKLVDAGDEYRITVSTSESFAQDLQTLLRFWAIKWRPRKGDLIDGLLRSNTIMLTRSFQSGLVFLPTFWHRDRPVAALATLMDARKQAFSFYMTGRDETFDGPPPGVILHAFSIRHAIENGFCEYDFLRGNEPYKYSYGCAERKIYCSVVETRNGKNLGGRIDPRSIPDVLVQATALHKKGKAAEAECGYRRILEVQPKHHDALHRLGQLLAAKGSHAEAKRLFKSLTVVRPDAVRAWICLAQVCESLGQHREAIQPYLEAMRLRPDQADGFIGLSRALVKLGRIEEVNNALLSTLGHTAKPSIRNWRASDGRSAVTHRMPEENQSSL